MKVIDTQYADNVFISIEKLVKNEKKKMVRIIKKET
jgi:hypothetical protein